jgi:hypothetical protein
MASRYYGIAFAEGGDRITIPDAAPVDGNISYESGWTLDYTLSTGSPAVSKPVSRKAQNGFNFDLTSNLRDIQETGLLAYNPIVNYLLSAYTKGSDGQLYRADVINGPASTAVNPVGDLTGTWVLGGQGVGQSIFKSGMEFLTTSSNRFQISAGRASAANAPSVIELTSTMVKNVDLVWVAGSGPGSGCMPSFFFPTPPNNTWYRIFAIKDPTTGDVDLGLDTDPGAVNLLADATGFTLYRRIGFLRFNVVRDVLPVTQSDNDPRLWFWGSTFQSQKFGAPDTAPRTAFSLDDRVPPDAGFFTLVQYIPFGGGEYVLITNEGQSDDAVSASNYTAPAPGSPFTRGSEVWAEFEVNGDSEIFLRTSAQASSNNSLTEFVVAGWIDDGDVL